MGGLNQRWSLYFVNDAFTDGRRFRILTVIDDFTRVSDLLCMSKLVHASPKKEHDNDAIKRAAGRGA